MNNNALQYNSDTLLPRIHCGENLNRPEARVQLSGLLLPTLGNHWTSSEPVASNCTAMSLPHFTGPTAKATEGTY